MHAGYEDILARINEAPKWWDSNGVPRFDDFHPSLCPDIYTDHTGLFLIQCEGCHKRFLVEMHASVFDDALRHPPSKWHYGDPPRHDGCAGETMNCREIGILEFWSRTPVDREWERIEKFEGLVDGVE